MTDRLLNLLLVSPPSGRTVETVADWWCHCRQLCAEWTRPVDQAIAGGYVADRVGWAFATAYQAALHALIPSLSTDLLTALCVTEAQGTAPRAMQSELTDDGRGGLLLNGAKRWTTLGPDGGLFLVAARDGRRHGERPEIRLVQVRTGAPGVHVQIMSPTGFVPEVPHARLRFENVPVHPSDLLPGDGYSRYVKPFRAIEDLHVHAGVLAYLVRESRRLGWPRDWTERAVANLLSYVAIAQLDPADAAAHVALAGAMAAGTALIEQADGFWESASDWVAASRWGRDRSLLDLAAGPRAVRIERAWSRLG